MIAFAKSSYAKIYAENTRETIRRRAIHQFVQGGILMRNPDEAGLATNSPRTHYALTAEVLGAVRAFGTPGFDAAAAKFREAHGGGLVERHAKSRRTASVTVVVEGRAIILSPGAHNRLQGQIVEQFVRRFASGGRVLYLGDTDRSTTSSQMS